MNDIQNAWNMSSRITHILFTMVRQDLKGFPIISFIASKTLDRFTSRLSKSPIEIDSLCIIPTARVYKWVDFPIKWYCSCDDCCDSTSTSSSSQLFMCTALPCVHMLDMRKGKSFKTRTHDTFMASFQLFCNEMYKLYCTQLLGASTFYAKWISM